MSIFEYDEEKELGISAAETAARVKEKFSMEEAEVQQSMKLYWERAFKGLFRVKQP